MKLLNQCLEFVLDNILIIFGLILLWNFKALSFEQFLRILEIVVWPIILFSAMLFFRKTFAYIFLSMEEFNFFGLKGKFKNVQEVIDERAQKILEERDLKSQYATETSDLNERIELISKEHVEKSQQADRFKEIATEALKLNDKLLKEVEQREKKIVELTDENYEHKKKIEIYDTAIDRISNKLNSIIPSPAKDK